MLKRTSVVFGVAFFAILIFVVSVFRSAGAKYVFTQSPSPSPDGGSRIEIDYTMPYSGRITPDNPLWPIKALRDRVLLLFAFSSDKKAETLLLFANKRIQMAQVLFEENKPDLAVSVITKAEKYLEEAVAEEKKARSEGIDNPEFMQSLALSTLKHREILESVLAIAPEDAKSSIVSALNYPKNLFPEVRNMIIDSGRTAPDDPYDGQ